MDRWQNKVAVVTGASSGIGAATAIDLVKAGLVVVALARREERLYENQKTLPENLQSHFHPLKCDVCREEEVKAAFKWIDEKLGGTDILVNNAGISRQNVQLSDPDNSQPIKDTVDTNIMAVLFCVREAFNSMKKRNFDGHILIVNSIAGHKVPILPGMNIYPATKFAVTAMVETYRQEFASAGTKVKVTSISPGLVDTEIIPIMQEIIKSGMPALNSEDISNAILFAISTPPHVQIHELTIKPVGEQF